MGEKPVPVQDTTVAAGGRQQLLGTVTSLQEMVARRVPLAAVYQAVVDGAIALLGADGASLRFRDPADPSWTIAVAMWPTVLEQSWHARAPISEGVSGRAIELGELVAFDDRIPTRAGSRITFASQRAAMAAPLREGERVVGSLLVACSARRHWARPERALMRDYARHAGALLAVARGADAVAQAFTDPLTRVGNRAFFLDRLEHELGRADRARRLVSVLFVDLDGFKAVNDTLGHQIGDQLLTAVAQRIQGCLRAQDACARLGGDEFAVLLGDGVEPALIAKRIIASLGKRFEIGGHSLSISASIGIASDSEDAEGLLRDADLAMYRAKRHGRASYELSEPRLRVVAAAGEDPDLGLRRMLDRAELDVRYQPIVDLRTGLIVAFEALLYRSDSSTARGSVHRPVPAASDGKLALELGRRLLEQAVSDIGAGGVTVSIDVSSRVLADPLYVEAVRSATAGALPPAALILELHDDGGLARAPQTLANLRALRALGVRIALDDFGVVQRSLLELSTLPLDVLKLAPPFIATPAGDQAGAPALLPALVEIARGLELDSVALGVDDAERLALVRHHGCGLAQGRILGEAVPADRATALMTETRRG